MARKAALLSEILESIDYAQRVAWEVGMSEEKAREARRLYAELEAVRLELEAMRLAPHHGDLDGVDPLWTSIFGR